jgi:hypothetical protein
VGWATLSFSNVLYRWIWFLWTHCCWFVFVCSSVTFDGFTSEWLWVDVWLHIHTLSMTAWICFVFFYLATCTCATTSATLLCMNTTGTAIAVCTFYLQRHSNFVLFKSAIKHSFTMTPVRTLQRRATVVSLTLFSNISLKICKNTLKDLCA